MDGVTINAKIYAGRAQAALRLGLDYLQYRPVSATNPLSAPLRTIKAAFNAGDSNYRAPNLQGDAIWYGDFDGRLTQIGDYLVRVSDGQTYYIAGQQQTLPIVCIDCNRTISLVRIPAASVGAVGYSGESAGAQVAALSGWPCSILFGGRSESTGTNLPSTNKNAGWRLLLPPSVPVLINASDILIDDLNRRFAVQAAEQSDLGWRIQAVEEHS